MAGQGQDSTAARRMERIRDEIARWRSRRRRCSPMPARLWNEAALLARDLGVHRIKCALGLNYESLKRRAGEVDTKRGTAGTKSIEFVELRGAQIPETASGPVVEVFAADGCRLTVRLAAGSAIDVAGLVEAFRGRRG
jgi:hypothetical protein